MPFVQLRRFPERGRDAVVRVQRPANGGHVIVIGAQLHGLGQRGRPQTRQVHGGHVVHVQRPLVRRLHVRDQPDPLEGA